MRLELKLPAIVPQMTRARVLRVLAGVGAGVPIGGALLELEVDLSDQVAHDCPPVAFYRLISREAAVVRALEVREGDAPEVGALLAVLTRAGADALEGPGRALRTSTAAVLPRWDMAG